MSLLFRTNAGFLLTDIDGRMAEGERGLSCFATVASLALNDQATTTTKGEEGKERGGVLLHSQWAEGGSGEGRTRDREANAEKIDG